jgi:hypothetical protein
MTPEFFDDLAQALGLSPLGEQHRLQRSEVVR